MLLIQFFLQGYKRDRYRSEAGRYRSVPSSSRERGSQHLRRIGQVQKGDNYGECFGPFTNHFLLILCNPGCLPQANTVNPKRSQKLRSKHCVKLYWLQSLRSQHKPQTADKDNILQLGSKCPVVRASSSQSAINPFPANSCVHRQFYLYKYFISWGGDYDSGKWSGKAKLSSARRHSYFP